jgi:ribosome-associated heat shock protein Hsp15
LSSGGSISDHHTPESPNEVRLDVWLDVVCLFRTRSEAQRACKGGKVSVNGQSAKPNRLLRAGDRIAITRPLGRTQRVTVLAVTDRHLAKAEARRLYEDVTPPPTAEEIEVRRLERIFRATVAPPHAPDKRERRLLRHLKGKS